MYQINFNQKKVGMTMLLSEKVDFKAVRTIRRESLKISQKRIANYTQRNWKEIIKTRTNFNEIENIAQGQ